MRGHRGGVMAARSLTHMVRRPGRHGVRTLALACAAATAMLAGCNVHMRSFTETAPAEPAPVDATQQAVLRSIGGSALAGKIRVVDRGDGASVLVSLINVPQGPYRIAFHETPNCSSPNGFSAGPPWAPAAAGKPPQDLVPIQYANAEARVETELRISGLHANGVNGVAGHSVVLYSGSRVTDIRPDVPNAAIACGVFEVTRTLSF
jgi:Cu/Zn superoxide dismutase